MQCGATRSEHSKEGERDEGIHLVFIASLTVHASDLRLVPWYEYITGPCFYNSHSKQCSANCTKCNSRFLLNSGDDIIA